jgi:hypothetical protein
MAGLVAGSAIEFATKEKTARGIAGRASSVSLSA